MNIILLIKGLLLGFVISMPVGPIGIICLRYNLLEGFWAGLFAGIGAATVDVLYASFAIFGLRFIIEVIQRYEHVLRFFAGLFLIGLSYFILKSKKRIEVDSYQTPPSSNLLLVYFTTFLITLSNPATILLFMTLFTALDVGEVIQRPLEAISLIAAIFLGSFFAWSLLAFIIHWFRGRMDRSFLWKINHYAGFAIGLIGILTIASLFFSLYC